MAAVSVGLFAKAEYDGTKTSFEEYTAGTALTIDDSDVWTSDATEGFVISNLTDFANQTKPSRPDYWATSSASDEKALTIDTDAPLFCKVNDRNSPYTFSNGPIFFDSVVQFTATDVAAEPESGDKLRVWLYESSEEVAQENSGDVSSTKQLVVTAAYLENGTYVTKHYYTDVEIEPDSWHRLTIKSFINNGFVTFSVWVDKTLVSAEGVTEFLSLQYTENKGGTAIQCVAFDGKGAVDDIVFTTTDPFAEPSYEVTVALSDSTAMSAGPTKYYSVDGGTTFVELKNAAGELATGNDIVLAIPVDVENIVFKIAAYTGYKIDGGASAGLADGAWGTNGYTYWTKTVAISDIVGEGTSGTVSLSVVENTVIVEDPVAQIGETKYATLQAAVDDATAGAEITVIADIETAGPVTVKKQVTINLGGKTITATNDKSGDGVFHVVAGGNLTLKGDGTVNAFGPNAWCMAVWADGGTVTINGGTYTNDGATSENDADHFDLIYVKNGGSVVINGGTFKCETPRWTLNKHNTTPGNFVVTGGKFFRYDPTNFDTDEAVTSWCPAGYVATLGEGDYYTVAEQTIKPVDPSKEDVVVTATSEPDALSKVELSVTVPDGVDAGKYKAYFKLSATDNGDGTWTVAAALDPEEVEPVIEATTDENGNVVTPAISFGSDGKVTINISNELPGLFYGVKYATTVGGVETAAAIPGLTVTPTAGDTAGFFRVVVDFKEIPAQE